MNPGRERLLQEGDLGVVAQLAESSNLGFVVDATLGEDYGWGVYKPLMGERPLHDFPPGLHRRERAAYLLSEHLGWGVVPPTVIREDAPFGVGSIQWFIEHDGWHYLPMLEQRPELHPQLKRMAVFDLLANNTDRKSGHVLLDAGNHVWGIDQGLCFSEEPKLRTVIWDFAHETIDDDLVEAVAPLVDSVPAEIAELLSEEEVWALRNRANRIVRLPFLPKPYSQFQYPWPLV